MSWSSYMIVKYAFAEHVITKHIIANYVIAKYVIGSHVRACRSFIKYYDVIVLESKELPIGW